MQTNKKKNKNYVRKNDGPKNSNEKTNKLLLKLQRNLMLL